MRSEPQRLFDSPLLDASSKTPWLAVPLLWLPVACAALRSASLRHGLRPAASCLCLAFGLLVWSLVEYAMHRFLFHVRVGTSFAAITLHYAFHGCHHKQPSDRLRLVFPPTFAAPCVLLFYRCWTAALGPGPGRACFAGMLVGYVLYDCIHHYVHQSRWRATGWLGARRRAHLAHHHLDGASGFGVSSALWDVLLGTQRTHGTQGTTATWPPAQ